MVDMHGDEWAEAILKTKAWPFEEARKIIARLPDKADKSASADPASSKKKILFQTGYGPSGPPHIGTFCEVARTAMVRHAFHILTGNSWESELICFSDDSDGLRKVSPELPQQEIMQQALGLPLYRVPNPYSGKEGTYDSFAAANNARLCRFLDSFSFEYTFMRSSQCYLSGRFDDALIRLLHCYDEVMETILPTLGPERRATYSPFLPICPRTGRVLQVPMLERDPQQGRIAYRDPETEEIVDISVKGGAVKCQWKADWALRWYAFGIAYEMSGKDLIDSVHLSSKICKILGGQPPCGFNYELFLDEAGQKISKTKGNGLSIEEWLSYASSESLSYFMFQKPKSAKRLHLQVIPKAVDEYYSFCAKYDKMPVEQKLANALWHIHKGGRPPAGTPISFSMMLNLVSACNAPSQDILWQYLSRYDAGLKPGVNKDLDRLIEYSLRYYDDIILPAKRYRAADEVESAALSALDEALASLSGAEALNGAEIQNTVYGIARAFPRYQDRSKIGPDGEPGVSLDWFAALYRLLLGQSDGPRLGPFIALYGIESTRALIKTALERKAPLPT